MTDSTSTGGANPIPVAICINSCHCKAPDMHSPNMVHVYIRQKHMSNDVMIIIVMMSFYCAGQVTINRKCMTVVSIVL